MKLKYYWLIVFAYIINLSAMVAKQQPDSSLTIANAYRLNLTDLPQALEIIENKDELPHHNSGYVFLSCIFSSF